MMGTATTVRQRGYWSRLADLAWNRDIERRIGESMGVVPVREPISSRSGAPPARAWTAMRSRFRPSICTLRILSGPLKSSASWPRD